MSEWVNYPCPSPLIDLTSPATGLTSPAKKIRRALKPPNLSQLKSPTWEQQIWRKKREVIMFFIFRSCHRITSIRKFSYSGPKVRLAYKHKSELAQHVTWVSYVTPCFCVLQRTTGVLLVIFNIVEYFRASTTGKHHMCVPTSTSKALRYKKK
jgi:succinate dehydrogenase/fumarate reductase cytochrome b subunit